MSIERQLAEAFKRNESAIECPPSLDARIMAEYRRLRMDKRGDSFMKRKWSLPKVAIIVVVVAVLSGFAYAGNKFLFSDSKGRYAIHMQTNEAFRLNQETLEKVRASLQEVQAELAPGETAVVYLPELAAKFNGELPPLGVTNPAYMTDIQQWKQVLEKSSIAEPLPDSLLGGTYPFQAGTLNSPFHFMMGLDAIELQDEMKTENKKGEDNRPLWRLTAPPVDIPQSYYTSVYRNANGEAIYISWGVLKGSSIKLEGISSPDTEYVQLDLNGQKAHYTKNDQSLYGDSNVFQGIMWIEEEEDQTIVYHVESDSASMTKERLIEAATSLQ
ncbi:hypothetical protein [Paenibacillus radicis (ex Gao et al. 2016)]|uniref:DUF4367 domain-containing protein n=1 Tax=Paenibacillus radicis (ex Gao et al. 2016) TaxID=1737354 RepID=A0A917M147_9BACL|nr:hypothetical protein [Paenibacillus radicis (ex Gao et al. 2016)]GGG72425.1 hypothetical protein GCM10010918_30260 [Paenibacillus radicis (ex Gao et al. 2016)]